MADDHDQFPQDITYEILSRLPVKSLGRFRCVSKSWLEYINDPHLQTIHVNEKHTPIMFELQHPNSSSKQCKLSFLRVIQGTTTMNVQKDPVLRFGYKGPYNFEKLVLGSYNGLTLVSYDQYPFHGIRLALINPVSKQRYDLPPVWIRSGDHGNRFHQTEAAGIGFDDSTNTLKTVCVILKETEYSICSQDIDVVRTKLCTMVHNSGMRSWREIPQNPAYPIIGPGLFAHGRLYWLVSSQWWSFDEGTKVVWFDVKTEEFGLTDPPKRKGGFWVNSQLVDLNGEVGYAYIDDLIDLWILKNEEWVLHCQIDQHPSHYYNKTAVVSGCFNKDGDILLTSDRGRRLFVYTLKTCDLRQVHRGDRCVADIRMYRSSLFSIRTNAYSIKGWSMRRRRRKRKV